MAPVLRFRALDLGLALLTNDYTGPAHELVGNTFTDNLTGVAFAPYSRTPYYLAPVSVTLRCNTFRSALAGATGVWVKPAAQFPSSLGSASAPNGNRFDGIADDKKRLVYDAIGTFRYYRYDSPQERFSGGQYNDIYGSAGMTGGITGSSPTPTMPGTNVCGGSTTSGVNARSAATPSSNLGDATTKATLGEAYPNPATVTVGFMYTLPSSSSPAVLVLRNMLGQCIAKQSLTHEGIGEVRLLVQHLPAGLYIGTIEIDGQVCASRKLTVVH